MTRIKITVGSTQIECEGEPAFIVGELPNLLERIIEVANAAPTVAHESTQIPERFAQSAPELSTNTIAQTMGVKTGSELALAAVAKINLIRARPTVTRQEILDEMKGATTYYKDSYASNLSSYLDTLVKSKRINLVSRGTYALAATDRGRLTEILGVGA